MKIKPLNNNLDKRNSSGNTTLYTGCSCCCCCVLAPIGSYITEKVINRKYPWRNHIWRHTFVNFVIIVLAGVAFFITTEIVSRQKGALIPFSVPILLSFILFYLYSSFWLKEGTVLEKIIVAVLETALTVILWAILSVASFYFVMWWF